MTLVYLICPEHCGVCVCVSFSLPRLCVLNDLIKMTLSCLFLCLRYVWCLALKYEISRLCEEEKLHLELDQLMHTLFP
jgi:hypothetical protein